MATILVIDAVSESRRTVREMLEDAGYLVLEASNGRAGVQACQVMAIDLVITDALLPEREGFETMRALEALFPPAKILMQPLHPRDLLALVRERLGES